MLVRFDSTPKDEKALAILQEIASAVCMKSTGPCGASQPCQGGGAAGTEVERGPKSTVARGFRISLWAAWRKMVRAPCTDALSSDTGAEALMKLDRKRTPFNFFFRPTHTSSDFLRQPRACEERHAVAVLANAPLFAGCHMLLVTAEPHIAARSSLSRGVTPPVTSPYYYTASPVSWPWARRSCYPLVMRRLY